MTPLERLELAVVEAFGTGSAVSVDRDRNMDGRLAWTARAWDGSGAERLSSAPACLHRQEAVNSLLRRMRKS